MTSKLSGIKHLFVTLRDSMIQEFGQGIMGAICFCSIMSGASAGRLEGQNDSKSCFLTYLVTDASCWLEPSLTLLARKSTYASSWSLGFLTAWHLDAKGKNPLKERDSKKLFHLFKPGFISHKAAVFPECSIHQGNYKHLSSFNKREVDSKARGKGSVLEKQVGQKILLWPFFGKCDLLPFD